MSSRILIVEDEFIVAADLEAKLTKLGHQVVGTAASGDEALSLAEEHRPHIVLMDIRLDGRLDGVEAASEIRNRYHIPVIFLTAHADRATLDLSNMASKVDVDTKLNLVITDVKQDGVPLNVGPNCHTRTPVVIKMKGDVSLDANKDTRLDSTYEIPPFAGCGTTENLDPLITGIVSGPGNQLETWLHVRCIGCSA